MVRPIVGLLGVITALVPDRIIALFEAVAIDNPDELTTRSWLRPAIRSEGILIAIVCLIGGRAYGWMMGLTGAFGAVLLLFPRAYLRLAETLVYDRPEDVEWSDRFVAGARAIGALYVLMALRTVRNRRRSDPS